MRTLVAKDVMNPEVVSVSEDMTLQELAGFLIENEISGAPVRNGSGRLVGVVSTTDIAFACSEEAQLGPDRSNPDFFVREWEETTNPEDLRELHIEGEGPLVRDIMNPALYSVDEETPVSDVAETMIESHVHRLLVTRTEQVVGIITTSDMLGLLVDED